MRNGNSERLIVIGGNAAGMSAASKAKRANPDLEVTLLEKTAFISYGACGLPYYVGNIIPDAEALFILTPEKAAQRGIDVHLNHEVLSINPVSKELRVLMRDEQKEITAGYDRLVIATGAAAVRPPIPGINLQNIHTLKSWDDARELKHYLDRGSPKRALVVGAGYIGVEIAENLALRGLEVTMVEMLPRVMGTVEEPIHSLITSHISGKGVDLKLKATVTSFEGSGKVERVETSSGSIPTDLVVVSAGVRPCVEIARECGITIGSTGAIHVDPFLRTSHEGIYAAGDCVELPHRVTGRPVFIPLALNANRAGRYAGINSAFSPEKEPVPFPGTLGSAVARIFDLEFGRTGISTYEASEAGMEVTSISISDRTKAGYWPDPPPITLVLTVEKKSRRLVGAQVFGGEGSAMRMSTLAAAVHNEMTIDEIKEMDLPYAPPFSPTWDPVLVAATVAAGKV